jgi:hypothetical protein
MIDLPSDYIRDLAADVRQGLSSSAFAERIQIVFEKSSTLPADASELLRKLRNYGPNIFSESRSSIADEIVRFDLLVNRNRT